MRQNSWLAIAIALVIVILAFGQLGTRNGVLGGIVAQDDGAYVGIRPVWNFTGTGVVVTEDVANNAIEVDLSAASGSPTDASYVTVGAEAGLSEERVITAGNGISVTDNGINTTVTLALAPLTADWNQTGMYDIILNNIDSQLKILEVSEGPTLFGIFTVADLTTGNKTYTFPNATGTVVTTGNLTDITTVGTIGAGTWQGTAINQAYVNLGTGGVDANVITLHDFLTGTPTTNYIPKWNGSAWAWAEDTGGAGSGDITDVGDVTTGAAFTAAGTAGTSLYFYDVQGRGQLTIANLTGVQTYTLPDATGEVTLLGQTISTAEVESGVTLDSEWNTQGEVETVWGATLATDSELSGHTGDASDPHGATLTQTNADILTLFRIREGGATPTLYGTFVIADLTTSGKSYTFPDANGEVSLLGQSIADGEVDNDITLTNITQITTRSHTSLTDIGTNSHAAIDTHIADSTIHYAQASITTVGTIGSGVWQGTAIADSYISSAATWNGKPNLVSAGTNGTAAANAGDDTTAARSDHEHYTYRDLVWFYAGTLATGDPGIWLRLDEAGASGDILSAYAVLVTAGSTASTADILISSQTNVDGTPSWASIFTTNKLLIDANERSTNTASTAANLTTTSWSANDHFRLNVDTAGTSAANLTVKMKIRVKNKAS